MTCIAAVWRGQWGAIAGDGVASFGGWTGTTYTDGYSKVVRLHGSGALFGASGTVAYTEPLRRALDACKALDSGDPGRVFAEVSEATAATIADLRALGHGKVADDGTWGLPMSALLLTRQGLFHLSGDGFVMLVPAPYFAVGSGRDHAMGALAALNIVGALDEQAPARAVEAAHRTALGIGPPVPAAGLVARWGAQ